MILVMAVVMMVVTAQRADAQVDNGDGTCVQSDGEPGLMGVYIGAPTDADCVTESDYEATFSVPGLTEAGALTDVVDNGDGTVSGLVTTTGVRINLIADPWQRPATATPELDGYEPTVRDRWDAVLHPGGGGPQEF